MREYVQQDLSCIYHEHTICEAYENTLLWSNFCSLINSPSELPRFSRMMTSYTSSLPYQSTEEVHVQPAIFIYTLYIFVIEPRRQLSLAPYLQNNLTTLEDIFP